MKNISKYLFGPALMAVLMLASCQKEDEYILGAATLMHSVEITMQDGDRAKMYVDDEIAKSVTLPMIVGESIQLGALTDPADLSELTYPELMWTSSNEDVLTVDEYGKMTAKAAGVSVVTVSPATINMVANSSIKVTVFATVEKVTSIEITDDSDHVSEFSPLPSCYIGETMTLSAKVTPENATYKSVLWSSKDESIAVIDPVSGVVTGVSQGEVEMVATALDAGKVTATHKIYIDRVITPTGIKMINAPAASDVFSLSDRAYQVECETYPEVATRSLITWTSSDTDVAKVDGKGLVTFVKYGEVEITASIPETEEVAAGFEKTVTMKFNIPAGFYRDHFTDKDNPNWAVATSGATQEWKKNEYDEAYLYIVPSIQSNPVNLRGDFKRTTATYISAEYPILCVRMDDVNDLGFTNTNIKFDLVGESELDGTKFAGEIGGGNRKWKARYKCSDGSYICVYDLVSQPLKTGGELKDGNIVKFNTFQFKYADIKRKDGQAHSSDHGAYYRLFWFHTFTSEAELAEYLNKWSETTSITFN
ncbi:MAG: Ig-like domain-containing protein [Candidatus Cryptobacteroides sp.]